jgi:putative tricarboxylic transport membrane protein
MKRFVAAICALAFVPLLWAAPATADTARIMVPASAGGGWDGTARQTILALQQSGLFKDGTQFTNKGGAGGTIGLAEFVRTGKGDDNALLFTGAIMVSSIITSKSPVSLDVTTPLARLTNEYDAIAVPVSSEIRTPGDLVDALRRNPGAVAVGGGSLGGVDHVTLALIAREAGVPAAKLNYIPFPGGGDVVTAVAGGKVKAAISGASELKPLADAGRLRIIAVTSPERLKGIDAPTLKEAGIDVAIGNWRGVVGAPGMSDKARTVWLDRFDKLSTGDVWKQTLERQGWEDAFLSGDAFVTFLSDEKTRWRAILKDVGLAD